MQVSLNEGKALPRQSFSQSKAAREVVSPVSRRVFVPIDSACASSCLDFVDLFIAFEGVTLVGEETSMFRSKWINSDLLWPLPDGLSDMQLEGKL